jgi:hypothetical protein
MDFVNLFSDYVEQLASIRSVNNVYNYNNMQLTFSYFNNLLKNRESL